MALPLLILVLVALLHVSVSGHRKQRAAVSIITAVALVGCTFLAFSHLPHEASAYNDVGVDGWNEKSGMYSTKGRIVYDESRITGSLRTLLIYFEGSAGALMMAVAGSGAVFLTGMAVGRRSRRLALVAAVCFVVAVAAFIGRSMMSTFKPVIYLYPEQTTDVDVKLRYKGTLTVTYPAYDPIIEGWRVTARPNGTLINSADRKEYSYLFWEGVLPPRYYAMPAKGFVVPGHESAEFLQNLLVKVGLTAVEYNELIVFWYPQIKDFPYVQIALAGEEYDQSAPLEISPKPESMLRVFLYFKRLSKPIEIQPQRLSGFDRKGFTVVEWGGTVMP